MYKYLKFLWLGILAFTLSLSCNAQDINSDIEITISSNFDGVAVYTGVKSSKKFIGYTPVKHFFYFRNDLTRHRIFLSKPGYSISEHLVGPKFKKLEIKLKKSSKFSIQTSNSDQLLRSIQNHSNKIVKKLFYAEGVRSKLIIPQGVNVIRDNGNIIFQLIVEIIDQESIKTFKAKNRIRNTKRRLKSISDAAVDEVGGFLKILTRKLQSVQGLDFIQATVFYPIASNKIIYSTKHELKSFYEVSTYINYATGLETTTTRSGYRPVTRHQSDISWGKEIASLRYLFPIADVNISDFKNDLTSKGSVFIWDKKNGDDQFLLIKHDVLN